VKGRGRVWKLLCFLLNFGLLRLCIYRERLLKVTEKSADSLGSNFVQIPSDKFIHKLHKMPSPVDATQIDDVPVTGEDLLKACTSGNLDAFIDIGQSLNTDLQTIKDDLGRSALHLAALEGHVDILNHLLQTLNFDINSQDTEGSTPLSLAAAKDNEQIVDILLQNDANVSLTGAGCSGPLHVAAGKGSLSIVKKLIQKGADIHTASQSGGEPVHWAAASGRAQVLEYLLQLGASPNNKNNSGMTPLLMAMAMATMRAKLQGSGSNGEDTNKEEDEQQSQTVTCVEILVNQGADVMARAPGDFTPLHIAAEGGMESLVTVLLEAKADPDAEDAEGVTPLDVAAQWGHRAVVEQLLKRSNSNATSVDQVLQHAEEQTRRKRAAAAAPVTAGHIDDPVFAIPEPEDQPDEGLGCTLKKKADEFFVAGDYEGAAMLYTTALQHWTRDATIWANRSAAHLKLEKYEAALRDAQIARTLDDKSAKAWGREGMASEALKRWEDAATAYYSASLLQPGNEDWENRLKSAIVEGQKEYQLNQLVGSARTGGNSSS
jgi:ankyrin repeat protein